MRRRRWAIAVPVGLVVSVAAVLLWPRGPSPCLETFEKVQVGMTRGEVYATVGGPPTRAVRARFDPGYRDHIHEEWNADDGYLQVEFGGDGRALQAAAVPANRKPFLDRLRDRLGL